MIKRNSAWFVLTAILMLVAIISYPQKEEVLFTVADEEITASEFLNVYKKNNVNSNVIDKKSLEEYLELYINFKLKVKEAEELGLDTVRKFKKELQGYRNQLAKPYLSDEDLKEKMIREAYERKKWDVRASHILIKVDEFAPPEDTLAAYNRIMRIRDAIIKGEDFSDVATRMSEDQSARDQPATARRPYRKGNKGDLGYFTVFDMLYPFESGAYQTQVGEISMPVRTIFGYHLIKVTDKKPAMGKAQVAHVLIQIPPGASKDDSLKIQEKAWEAYRKIENGIPFEEVVKEYSDDKGSVEKGGLLPWFGVNRMIPEFIIAISQLEEKGEVTEPFISLYGWHIVKLIDKKEVGSFEENLQELNDRFERSDRSREITKSFIRKLKKEYGFKDHSKNITDIYRIVTDTIFLARWHPDKDLNLSKPLFELDGGKYTQKDFVDYLEQNQKVTGPVDLKQYIHEKYHEFVNETIIDYEDSKLEQKYPEFKALVKEYRDGILLFELTDQKIWSKAIEDSAGLTEFYKKNQDKYMWGDRVDAVIYIAKNEDVAKEVRKMISKEIPYNEILETLNKDTVINLTTISNTFEKGDNELIDQIPWEKGLSDNIENEGKIVAVDVRDVIPPQPKKLSEARGIITADYQNYLEKEWIKTLREKYPVTVNKDVLSRIK